MHFLVFKLETYLGGPAFVHALRCATDAVRTMVGATTTESGQNDIRVSTYDPPAPPHLPQRTAVQRLLLLLELLLLHFY